MTIITDIATRTQQQRPIYASSEATQLYRDRSELLTALTALQASVEAACIGLDASADFGDSTSVRYIALNLRQQLLLSK